MKPIDDLSDAELAPHLRAAVALADAPAEWVHAAIGQWERQRHALPVLVRRLLASLVFDSAAAAPAMLATRAGRAAARHLLFSAEGRDIDLRIIPLGERFALVGQVLGPGDAGRFELLQRGVDEGIAAGVAVLNDLGEFRIEGIAAGRYQAVLTLGHDEITLPPLDIGDVADLAR